MKKRIVLSRTLTAEQLRAVRGAGLGTSPSAPEYMSPEQARRAPEVGPREFAE